MLSIWRPIGWILGVVLYQLIPQAEARLADYRTDRLSELQPPAWEGQLVGNKGGAAGTAKKPAGTRQKAVQPAKAPAAPRGRPPAKPPSERAVKAAEKARKERNLENLAKARAARAKNLAAKKRAEKVTGAK